MIWTTSTYRPRVNTRPGSFGDQEIVNGSNVAFVALPVYGRCVGFLPDHPDRHHGKPYAHHFKRVKG